MQPAARKWDLISKVSVFFWALIVIFLAGYLLIANPGKVFAGDPPPSNGQPNGMNGKGYAFDPYVIKTCQNLQDININPRGFYYILGNDIDCSETTSWNGGNGFLPIGASLNGYRFEGSHLDGKGHTISNIFMKCQVMPNDWDNEFGLFTYVGSNTSFSNFKIIGAQYEAVNCNGNNSEYYVGGIYGRGEAVIADVSFEGSITRSCDAQSTNNVGGLVGYGNYQNSIQRSHSTGTIDIYGTGCSGKFSAGGIIGSAYDPSIIDSYSTTDITSGVQFAEPCYYGSGLCQVIGGLIGENYTYDPLFTIQNSYAAGSISLT